MSVRKKRMIFMVVGVFLCCLIVLFLGERAMRSDREEYARKCKYYEGIWESKKRDFELEIHRVSSGTLFFSMENRTTSRELRLLTARAVEDDVYEFSYQTYENRFGRVKQIRPGQKAKGTISLTEKGVKIDFPEIPGKKRGLEYTGVLFWKSDLPTQKISHLVDYMGTKKKPEGEMSKYCSFGYDDSGKVWRVHAMLNEYGENYKTDILGIGMNSSISECESRLGNLISETELMWGGRRRRYENSDYVSTVITNEYGVIVELDCQIASLPGTNRQGDFVMRGDTAYRFAGDYSKGKNIDIPKNTKRIASHAFDVGEHCYTLIPSRKYIRNINIPSNVFVEEYAFANCGPLHITLQNGWKEIPRRAFAHMVSVDVVENKGDWVKVVLPASLEKIEDEAFALGESTKELNKFWQGYRERFSRMPVSVDALAPMERNLYYVGDNAFWGIGMSDLPNGVKYLGKNYTIYMGDGHGPVSIPETLTVLKEDALYILGVASYVYFPDGMKEIEDGAIRGYTQCSYRLTPEGEKRGGYLKESEDSGPKWILSKDGKILYAANGVGRGDHYDFYYGEDGDFIYGSSEYYTKEFEKDTRYQNRGEKVTLTVPEGIEEIHGLANLQSCDKIIFPKSLKKLNINAIFYGYWSEIVFQGGVPEITGDRDLYVRLEGRLEVPGTFKVKKGNEEKMLCELMKGEEYSEEEEREFARHITTF